MKPVKARVDGRAHDSRPGFGARDYGASLRCSRSDARPGSLSPHVSKSRHPGAFLLAEAPGNLSRDNILIAAFMTVLAGQVLGRANGTVTVGAAVAAAGNTGTGAITFATPAYGASVKEGPYRLVCIEPAANAGKFALEDPDGIIVAVVTVAVAHDGAHLKLTVADDTDFAAGDSFTIPVSIAASATHKVLAPAGTDGTQIAAANRALEVNGKELEWPAGISAEEKALAITQLAAQHIKIVRS